MENVPWSRIQNDLRQRFPLARLFQLFGLSGSGKSFVLLYAAVQYAEEGQRVVFLDCDSKISPKRLQGLTASQNALLNITVFSVRSVWEALETIDDLDIMGSDDIVLLVDNLLRPLITSKKSSSDITGLAVVLHQLKRIAQRTNQLIFFTNEARIVEKSKFRPYFHQITDPFVDLNFLLENRGEMIWVHEYDSLSQTAKSPFTLFRLSSVYH